MNIESLAKADLEKITSDINGWGTSITFTTPDGSATVSVVGRATKYHLGINGETGQRVNTKTASVGISERFFGTYPIRVNGEVSMFNHRVSWIDSTGTNCNYIVKEWYPDERLGYIIFILGDLE